MTRGFSRAVAPLLAAGALLSSLWLGVGPAAASTAAQSTAAPSSVGIVAGHHHWDDDYDYDYGHRHYRGHKGNDGYWYDDPDADLEDYPYCDRRGDGYGCPEYGYPPR